MLSFIHLRYSLVWCSKFSDPLGNLKWVFHGYIFNFHSLETGGQSKLKLYTLRLTSLLVFLEKLLLFMSVRAWCWLYVRVVACCREVWIDVASARECGYRGGT